MTSPLQVFRGLAADRAARQCETREKNVQASLDRSSAQLEQISARQSRAEAFQRAQVAWAERRTVLQERVTHCQQAQATARSMLDMAINHDDMPAAREAVADVTIWARAATMAEAELASHISQQPRPPLS